MGGQQGGQDSDKDSYALLYILAAVAVVSLIVWHFWSHYLKVAFIAIKKYEAIMISFFVENDKVNKAVEWLTYTLTPAGLSMDNAGKISDFLGYYLAFPVCFILGVMAIIMFRGHATMRYNKAYNMDTLVQQEKENYPQIAPVADLKLIEEDILKGPWGMSLNPMQFARHEKLLKVELVADSKAAWKSEGIAKATVIRELATQTFANQLGPLWSGIDNLPPHTKAIFAAFCARAEHDTDACRAYLGKLARSASKGTMDYSDTDELIKKYAQSKAVQKCIKRHAYVLTVMASMLVLARVDGVLASADFLWLKPIDRKLWYVLNCVGRQVSVAEVSGVFAHWFAEKEMCRPLTVPMVDEATNALEFALSKMIYVPDEDEVIQAAEQ